MTCLASELCLQSRVPFLVGKRAGCQLIAAINRTRTFLTGAAASVLHLNAVLQPLDGATHQHQLLAASQRNESYFELYILVLPLVVSATKPVIGSAAAPCAANVVTDHRPQSKNECHCNLRRWLCDCSFDLYKNNETKLLDQCSGFR